MGTASGKRKADHLSAEELITAYDGLSAADKFKLDRIDGIRRGGTGFKPGELLHKAMCGVIFGKRHCPRDVPVIAFLAQTMRSMASHERERLALALPLHEVPREGDPIPAATSVAKAVDAVAIAEVERTVRSADTAEAILAVFEGDEIAQLILLGWLENCHGKALRDVTGLDQTGLDYAIRRIKTKMRKLYPNGWTP